jgi:hypothetical protein
MSKNPPDRHIVISMRVTAVVVTLIGLGYLAPRHL